MNRNIFGSTFPNLGRIETVLRLTRTVSFRLRYLGNGCCEYNFWNCILTDKGESPWGWKQNALIRVDSEKRTFVYTPEYYA